MSRYILTLAIIVTANCQYALQFTPMAFCDCNELTSDYDCGYFYPICQWSNYECHSVACNQIMDQVSCSKDSNCMWQNRQCVDFVKCNALQGYSQQLCESYSAWCVGTNGTNCESYTQKCSEFNNPQTCNSYLSSEGACYWNQNNTCIAGTACALFDAQFCNSFIYGDCKWDDYFQICKDGDCGQYQTEQQCTYIGSLLKNSLTLCLWQQNQCIPAQNASVLNSSGCIYETLGTYHWDLNTNSCVSCKKNAGTILNIFIIALIITY